MLGGLFFLLTLSVLMFVSSFLAGLVPLSISLSQSQLRVFSTIGMGVLVGTSLIVIIPEGIEAIYTAHSKQAETRRGLGEMANMATLTTTHIIEPRWASYIHQSEDADIFNNLPIPIKPSDMPVVQPSSSTKPRTNNKEHSDPPTFWIGFSLITGFILMYLIDTLPYHASNGLQRPVPTRHISLNEFSMNSSDTSPPLDPESSSFLDSFKLITTSPKSFATTVGLIIHAAADGIALGASTTATPSLSLMIFLAIMVHKAPAAFGLTSVLLKQGISKRAARGHLMAFSLAAPLGALGTFFVIGFLEGGRGENGEFWTGVLLLFSGGTFL